MKTQETLKFETNSSKNNLRVMFDGSCWPNPHGRAGYGFVVYLNEVRIHEGRAEIGNGHGMTNNVAEAAGLCAALDYLLSESLSANDHVLIQGDSQVVINVASGRRKNPKGFFVAKALEARSKVVRLRTMTTVELKWIPRELNAEADELSQTRLEA